MKIGTKKESYELEDELKEQKESWRNVMPSDKMIKKLFDKVNDLEKKLEHLDKWVEEHTAFITALDNNIDELWDKFKSVDYDIEEIQEDLADRA